MKFSKQGVVFSKKQIEIEEGMLLGDLPVQRRGGSKRRESKSAKHFPRGEVVCKN